MRRQIAAVLVIVAAALAPSLAHADGPIPTFVGCPVGQAIRGINFVTRALVCVPVGGDTAALQAQITALQNALASAQATIACMHAVGTDVFFDGCNVHIRSGAGTTDAVVNGLGNLIVGYNEDSPTPAVRTGSHNLVVGQFHTYSSYGGFVAGMRNSLTEANASVSGGISNTASGSASSVSGGSGNTASGFLSSVSGGNQNTASQANASVSGGGNNTASSGSASVSGGSNNTASGPASSVSGGSGNTASGFFSSVSGGNSRSAPGADDWAAGSLFEDF
jgi:hypothetical protein